MGSTSTPFDLTVRRTRKFLLRPSMSLPTAQIGIPSAALQSRLNLPEAFAGPALGLPGERLWARAATKVVLGALTRMQQVPRQTAISFIHFVDGLLSYGYTLNWRTGHSLSTVYDGAALSDQTITEQSE